MGNSEKGQVEIGPHEFPPEKTEEVSNQFGDKTSSEAVKEVPKA